MQRFKITKKGFPELKGNELSDFIEFMKAEFPEYIEDKNILKAHNSEDSHWFTRQYLDGKSGKGIYQDWFQKKKNNHPAS